MGHDSSVQIFLETERLVLRRFTADDIDNLVELDSDPDVMRFINGGRPTPRHEIESDVLPAYLEYYERFAGYGFWAAIEKSTGRFLGWFHFRPAAQIGLGEGLRDRGLARADREGLRRSRRSASVRVHDRCQHRVTTCDGESRPEVRTGVSPALAGQDRGRGAR